MSKKYIGKKLLALGLLGAAVGGIIIFFKKFEQEPDEEDYDGFEVPSDCDDCDEDCASRNYTTISNDSDVEDNEEVAEEATDEVTQAEEAVTDKND